MTTYRYLLNLAYMGKPFCGAQRQVKGGIPRPDDPKTVQGRLEMALKLLRPCNEPIVTMASRTDSGVNALNSACHVDLVRQNGMMYDPRSITVYLNKYFSKKDISIRVLRSLVVPNMFHCRHKAISRTYLYRMIVTKAEAVNIAPHSHFIPIEELGRSLFYCTNTFDINSMREAAKLFIGVWDFRTFMGKRPGDENLITRKEIMSITIEKTFSPAYSIYSWPNIIESKPEDYVCIGIYVKGKGFLYKQVRRTVATLVAVAQGKITLKDIKFMLEVPSHHSWFPQIKTVPAHGLYLCDIEYNQNDLLYSEVCLK